MEKIQHSNKWPTVNNLPLTEATDLFRAFAPMLILIGMRWTPWVLAHGRMRWETECRSTWAAKLGPGPHRPHTVILCLSKQSEICCIPRETRYFGKALLFHRILGVVPGTQAKRAAQISILKVHTDALPIILAYRLGVQHCSTLCGGTASADTEHCESALHSQFM